MQVGMHVNVPRYNYVCNCMYTKHNLSSKYDTTEIKKELEIKIWVHLRIKEGREEGDRRHCGVSGKSGGQCVADSSCILSMLFNSHTSSILPPISFSLRIITFMPHRCSFEVKLCLNIYFKTSVSVKKNPQ